jgi:hypothetical protein
VNVVLPDSRSKVTAGVTVLLPTPRTTGSVDGRAAERRLRYVLPSGNLPRSPRALAAARDLMTVTEGHSTNTDVQYDNPVENQISLGRRARRKAKPHPTKNGPLWAVA